ncbi:MAG: HAMP domain-containing sensor histidine kinase [Planctomycetota bacterium]|nr:HAMP domain-containing sensor histidine kinase [Planctomycetota bacterium]
MEISSTALYDQERLLRRIDELSTRVRQLETESERLQRLATLGMLSGSIAHEFNNILTPVLSYAQMSLARPDDAGLAGKALQKAVDGTQKASLIASAMLGFIRDDEQGAEAAVRSIAVDALNCLGRDLAKDGIDVELAIPRELTVAMRPLALEQVLVNLILNAVEAMRPGTGRLRITGQAERQEESGGGAERSWVRIEVEDSGRGIPPEILDRVFDPFFSQRVGGRSVAAGLPGEGRAAPEKGTGLGLSICRRLVNESGGTIDVRSKVGEGTTFTIRVPRGNAAAA